MSEQEAPEVDNELLTDHDDDTPVIRALRQQLREKAKAEKSQGSELEELRVLKKQKAFSDAGLRYDSGPAKLLFEKYDGEWTAEAIKQAADDYGVTSQQTAEKQDAPQGEEQAHQRMSQAVNGGGVEAPSKSPNALAWDAHAAALEATNSHDDAMASYFRTKLDEAMSGRVD